MLFQVTKICFNEPDYITLHSVMNIVTEHDAKMTYKMPQIMVLSYCYMAHVRKGLLQEHIDRFCSLVKLLNIYYCYLNLLNHG